MPILESDIVQRKTRVMDDVPEGGGAPVGTVVVDDRSNDVFDDINGLDTANGNVSLRKTVAHVDTDNAEKYAGVIAAVLAPPGDPLLSLTLFQTDNFFSTRAEAVSRLESYLAAGGAWNGYLYGLHVAGQQMIQLVQRPDTELPKVSAVFALVQDEGYPAQVTQYVRVKRVAYQLVTFSDDGGDYQRWVVSCETTAPLERDFKGQEVTRSAANKGGAGKTIIRSNIVANAARYYGYQPLSVAASMTEMQIRVPSIYTQLVPSSEIDVPIADAAPNSAIFAPVASASGELTTTLPVLNAQTAGYLGGSAMPGSVRGTSASNSALVDKGDGKLLIGDVQVGNIDHQNGLITVTSGSYGGNFAFVPAAYQSVASESASVPFTAESRPGSIALTINPVPAPGSLVYTYYAQGQRYVLRDDGSGALRGDDPSYGAGKLNRVTGGLVITMGALPDAPSLGVLNWAACLTVAKGYVGQVKGKYLLKAGVAMAPAVTTLTWDYGGQARTASISATGAFSGAATGTINWATGEIEFSPTEPLAPGAQVSIGYTEPVTSTPSPITLTLLDQGASLEATLSGGCAPKAFRGQIAIAPILAEQYYGGQKVRTIEDDGAGNVCAITVTTGGSQSATTVGTINYSTGLIRLSKLVTFGDVLFEMMVGSGLNSHRLFSSKGQIVASSISGVTASGAATALAHTLSVAAGALRFELPRGAGARFVAGSITLAWGVRRYVDRLGRMVHSINPATGASTDGGSIDYQSGIFTPTDLAGITTTTATLLSSAEQGGLQYLTGGCFLTPVAPIRSGQLSIAATLADGASTQVNSAFATTGYLVSDHAVGVADFQAGWVRVWFRSLAAVAGLTEPVDLTAYGIPGVTTINAIPALAESFRFNCVGYSYLPVDADILGIDPVRLPPDGRVPIYLPGQLLLIHHTDRTAPKAVSVGSIINAGRTRLGHLRLIDADEKTISSGYTADLDAGTATITDITGYRQPIRLEHRIQDLIKILEANINGTIKLARRLTHDFPLGSGASSAMIIGDMRARVSVLFDQATWTKVWADAPIGDTATGTYDDIHYPIEVTNSGAFTERWALVFTNTTTFYVMGEHLGVIGEGNTGNDFSVQNPVSGTPYFTLRAAGFGNGFSAGNVIRFNTIGAMAPIWNVLTCQMGVLSGTEFNPVVGIIGDVDRP